MVGGSLIADAVAEALPAWLDGRSGGRNRSVARWELSLNDFVATLGTQRLCVICVGVGCLRAACSLSRELPPMHPRRRLRYTIGACAQCT